MSLKYTKEHEWIAIDGDRVIVGITDYAQEQLGEVVYVDLPDVDTEFSEGDDICTIESVKAASDICAPLDGQIVAVNEDLQSTPELLNKDPLGEGWIFKMEITNKEKLDDFLSEEAYQDLIAAE